MHITLCPSVLIKTKQSLDSNSAKLLYRLLSRSDDFKLNINENILEEYQKQLLMTPGDSYILESFLKELTRWMQSGIEHVVKRPKTGGSYTDFRDLILLFLETHTYAKGIIEDFNNYSGKNITGVTLLESQTFLNQLCARTSANFNGPVSGVIIDSTDSTQNNKS